LRKTLITIVGPTAIGKTTMAIKIAGHCHTEIISADSRQFYRELNIGTAKPSADELQTVKHHLINSLSIKDNYNVGQFEIDSLKSLDRIFLHHDHAVAAGGSGLFVNILWHGMDQLPESDPETRTELNSLLEKNGIEALQKRLSQLDPEYYELVDRSNPHRLIRALEVCMLTGMKYSEVRKNEKKKRDFAIVKIGLDEERDKIYQRINKRVDSMMENGLLDEAKSVFEMRNLNALQTVGYKELFDHLENKISLDEAVELIKRNTRRFAKRQLTWFRKDPEIKWFRPEQEKEIIIFISSGL
jgi:tRNA dimethylallyltransferase